MKDFTEALQDGFHHITHIDREYLVFLRNEGYLVDQEGYYKKSFGENNYYDLCVFPIGDEGEYAIFVAVRNVPITIPLLVWTKKTIS